MQDGQERLIYGCQRRHILHSMPLGGGGWDCSAGSALLYAQPTCISHYSNSNINDNIDWIRRDTYKDMLWGGITN